MPSSAVLRFHDPDEYQVYLEGLGISLKATVMTPGTYPMELMTVKLEDLLVTRGRISVPHISHGCSPSSLTTIFFYSDDNHATSLLNGRETPPDSVTVAPVGADYFSRSPTELDWSSLSVAPTKLAATARALLGYELEISTSAYLTHPPRNLLRRRRNVYQATCHLAEAVRDLLAHPEVIRAMEQQLCRAMVDCLAGDEARERNTVVHNRTAVMHRFEDALVANWDSPVYVTEICARVGVSERTLRQHCMDHLGVSPHRYLWLRRMNLARWTLARADPRTTSVTEIAMDCGFGELGRFAVAYKRLFGESPSTTLAGGTGSFGSSPGNDFNRFAPAIA